MPVEQDSSNTVLSYSLSSGLLWDLQVHDTALPPSLPLDQESDGVLLTDRNSHGQTLASVRWCFLACFICFTRKSKNDRTR